MNTSHLRKDLLVKTANVVHKVLLAVSGGRIGNELANMSVVKLTTTGRTSGKSRTVMLTAPLQDGDRYVLVASKGGDDRHPDWYRNLVANPLVTLEPVGSDPISLTARTATGDERDELWTAITTKVARYAGYQERTDRTIPVVVCEPTS